MHPIEHIRQLAKLTPELEYAILNVMREHTFRKGDTISGAVNLTSYAYYITRGAARIFYLRGGKEHTVSFSFDDEFVVISRHVVKEHADTVVIQFLEPTSVIFVPHTQLKDLLEKFSAVNLQATLLFLNTALHHYCQLLEEMNYVMQSRTAEERYLWALRRYPRLTKCATLTQMASFLGVTKETLYRIKGGKYSSSHINDTSKRKKTDDNTES